LRVEVENCGIYERCDAFSNFQIIKLSNYQILKSANHHITTSPHHHISILPFQKMENPSSSPGCSGILLTAARQRRR
jgi:hypothetical protein